ncbi:hypothetical protein Efla_006437 [Eimeria flavescens]
MEVEQGPSVAAAAAAASSTEASQENDQAQANSAGGPQLAAPLKQEELQSPAGAQPRMSRGAGGPQRGPSGPSFKGRAKCKAAAVSAAGTGAAWGSSKFVSPEAVLEAARRVKDQLPEVTPELLENLRARGLEPCTLQDVLNERKLEWAVTQVLDERAAAEHRRLLEAFQRQCEGWGNNREGWVHSKWHSVIVCPDFKRGGLQVSRSSMREMWNSIMSVVNGYVCPDLLICRVTDPTHPVRFATPPVESCFTVVYAGKAPVRAGKERKILGEYTGHVRAGSKDEQRFEYVFDLSFCALAWRAAEEFEKDSDSSGDEATSHKRHEQPCGSPLVSGPAKKNRVHSTPESEAEPSCEGKRRVQVTGSQNIKRVPLPVRGELVLDSHDACNQMSLVNHYGTIGLLGEKVCHVNTEWQQVFVDGWPHVVLTTIPGVAIEPGDEVLADFGYDWFNRVQDASHKAIARELLDYRIGAKTGGCQTLAPGRKAECVVRDSDQTLQTRARMGEVCPYCHSDEIPTVSSPVPKSELKGMQGEGTAAGARDRKARKQLPSTQAEAPLETRTPRAPVWGEQVVHCDGCDRPCHLRCIFASHSLDGKQQPTEHAEQQESQSQQGPEEEHLANAAAAAAESASAAATRALAEDDEPRAFGVVAAGECVEDVYRWFVEGDCKWYCCVCRLQWERMAAAMNFTVDWGARQVLSAGNSLLQPLRSVAAARPLLPAAGASRASEDQKLQDKQDRQDSHSCGASQDKAASSNKRRRFERRRGSGGSASSGPPNAKPLHPAGSTRSSAATAAATARAAAGEQACECEVSVTGSTMEEPKLTAQTDGLVLQRREGGVSLVEEERPVGDGAPTATAQTTCCSAGGIEKGSSASYEASEGTQAEGKPAAASDAVAGLSTAAPDSPISGGDSDVQPRQQQKKSAGCGSGLREKEAAELAAASSTRGVDGPREARTPEGLSLERTPQRGAEERCLMVEEAMRVYKNSSERAKLSKMQPCPVAINSADLSSEELLGCRTHMLVEPRALLGALQPCVRCYELYGAKASVEVCRLTKRHLGSNWDHPDFASPAQIQDALLTCFQDALLTLQREHREKLHELLEHMSPFEREVNAESLLSGNRYPRIHSNAARRSEEDTQNAEINATPKITKGVIPLLSVTLGKTKIDYKYQDPDTKKMKWYHGCVADYQAIAPEKVAEQRRKRKVTDAAVKEKKTVYFTNQFGINYDDGDRETVPADRLLEMLMETGPGSRLDGRKAITTTPLIKMLAPELKKAIRQTNRIVRDTNRKGVLTISDSEEE